MNGFIDIHNHCAWDIDDGMESEEKACISLQQAQQDGITAIIATPHFVPGLYSEQDIFEINARIHELKSLAEQYGIQIYSGAEVFLNSSYLDMIDSKLFNTLAESDYVLVEFDVRKELGSEDEVEDKLYEIAIRGYTPIIAHVERYFHGQVNMKRVEGWIKQGYGIQINRTSLNGAHGSICKEHAQQLLDAGFVHVIASDTHRSNGTRICKLSDVYASIMHTYGKQTADILCIENPKRIIANQELQCIPVVKKSMLKRLWKRS